MTDYEVKKRPKQARAQATFDAVIEAAARILEQNGYTGLTTNHIADVAGVSIGTLYEFFPNKESVVAELAQRTFTGILGDVRQAVANAINMDDWDAIRSLIDALVASFAKHGQLLRVLLRQVPFIQSLPELEFGRQQAFALAEAASETVRDRINLTDREAETWLITRMVYNAVLETALSTPDDPDRKRLTDSLASLVYRMLMGSSPSTSTQ